MDKAEYRIKLEQINALAEEGRFHEAADVADEIDWRHVKSARTLCMVGEIYEADKRYEDSRTILKYAYKRSSSSKTVLYRLAELDIRTGNYDEARKFLNEFEQNSPNDTSRFILKYKLLRARRAPIEDQIDVLKEYKDHEYTERWAYELARLYKKNDQKEKCIEECDDMILWFAEGKYVTKALELKQSLTALTPAQQAKYDNRFRDIEPEEPAAETAEEGSSLSGIESVEKKILEDDDDDEDIKPGISTEEAIVKMDAAAGRTFGAAERDLPLEKKPEANPSLQEKLTSSIRAVFSGIRGQEKAEEADKVVADPFEKPVSAEDKLAAEAAVENPEIDLDAVRAIREAAQKEVKEEAPAPKKNADGTIDLDELFAETGNALAGEVASGNYVLADTLESERAEAEAKAQRLREEARMKLEAAQKAAEEAKKAQEAAAQAAAAAEAAAAAAAAKEEAAAKAAAEAEIKSDAADIADDKAEVIGKVTEDVKAAEDKAEEISEKIAAGKEEFAEDATHKLEAAGDALEASAAQAAEDIKAKKEAAGAKAEEVSEKIAEKKAAFAEEFTADVEADAAGMAADIEEALDAGQKKAEAVSDKVSGGIEGLVEKAAARVEAAAGTIEEDVKAAEAKSDEVSDRIAEDKEKIADRIAEDKAVIAEDLAEDKAAIADKIAGDKERIADRASEISEAAAAKVEAAKEVIKEANEAAAKNAEELEKAEKQAAEEARAAREAAAAEAEAIEEAVIEDVETAEEAAAEGAEAVEEAVIEDVEAAEEAAAEGAEAVEEAVIEDVEAAEEAAAEGAEAVEEAIIEDVEAAEEAAAEGAEAVEESVIEDVEAAEEAAAEEPAEAEKPAEASDEDISEELARFVKSTLEEAETVPEEEDSFVFTEVTDTAVRADEAPEAEAAQAVEEIPAGEETAPAAAEETVRTAAEAVETVDTTAAAAEDIPEEKDEEADLVGKETDESLGLTREFHFREELAKFFRRRRGTSAKTPIESPEEAAKKTVMAAVAEEEAPKSAAADFAEETAEDAAAPEIVAMPELMESAEEEIPEVEAVIEKPAEPEAEEDYTEAFEEEDIKLYVPGAGHLQEEDAAAYGTDEELRNALLADQDEAVPELPQEDLSYAVSGDEASESSSIIENIMEESEIFTRVPVEGRELSSAEKKVLSYFAAIPGIDRQTTAALADVHNNCGNKTSRSGNIVIMGRQGSGKTRLADGLTLMIAMHLGLKAVKSAKIVADVFNTKDPAEIVNKMAGGVLIIEAAGSLSDESIAKLNRAMEFRTDDLIVILEDEKADVMQMLNAHPEFAEKFTSKITVPVFTNDELVSFARVYAREEGYKFDEMATLALYTMIGDNQKESEPMTVGRVREMVDMAIERNSRKIFGKVVDKEEGKTVLQEKDFNFTL